MPVTPNPALQFETPTTGWRVVGQGATAPTNTTPTADLGLYWPGNAVETTTNGGSAWARSLSDPSGIWGLDFISSTTGWAVGTANLYETTNGGQSWQLVGVPSPSLVAVDFLNASIGYGITNAGALEKSTDGGHVWQRSSFIQPVSSVCFTTAHVGYLATQLGGFIEATVNGGASWALSFSLPFALTSSGAVDTALTCAGNSAWAMEDFGNAFGTANTASYAVARTLDGGATWTMVGNNVVGTSEGGPGQHIPLAMPTSILTTGPTSAALVGYSNSGHALEIASTSNGGSQFVTTSVPLPISVAATAPAVGELAIYGLAWAAPTNAWILIGQASSSSSGMYNCAILTSSDSGSSWSTLSEQAEPVGSQ